MPLPPSCRLARSPSRHQLFWIFRWIILCFVFIASKQKKVRVFVCRACRLCALRLQCMRRANSAEAMAADLIKNSLSHTYSSYRNLISVSELMCCVRMDVRVRLRFHSQISHSFTTKCVHTQVGRRLAIASQYFPLISGILYCESKCWSVLNFASVCVRCVSALVNFYWEMLRNERADMNEFSSLNLFVLFLSVFHVFVDSTSLIFFLVVGHFVSVFAPLSMCQTAVNSQEVFHLVGLWRSCVLLLLVSSWILIGFLPA